jgi:hypothetical protein
MELDNLQTRKYGRQSFVKMVHSAARCGYYEGRRSSITRLISITRVHVCAVLNGLSEIQTNDLLIILVF